AGQTNSSLLLSAVQTADEGGYSVIVTNLAGSATSQVATLTVLVPPAITRQPASQTVLAGSPVTFSIMATGTATLAYQWRRNGLDLAGQNMSALTYASAQGSDAGDYSVVVANAAGAATSQVATLTVLLPPSITQQP